MGEFNSDDHYIYYCGHESLRRNEVATMVNKRVRNAVLGCNLKNNRMISVHFQGKPFNITVIQAYAPTSNVEEAEVEWFYEELQDLLELTPKKRCPFHYRGLECKSRKSRRNAEWGKAKTNRVLPRKCTGHSTHPIPTTTREDSAFGLHQIINAKIRLIIFFAAKDGEALYRKQKQDRELTVAQIMNSLLKNSDLNLRK